LLYKSISFKIGISGQQASGTYGWWAGEIDFLSYFSLASFSIDFPRAWAAFLVVSIRNGWSQPHKSREKSMKKLANKK